uniref:Secreted protein n=1 Tax=Panagrellus redivivus TaxID=6233 RepID=A0A7E4VQH5_PANRE
MGTYYSFLVVCLQLFQSVKNFIAWTNTTSTFDASTFTPMKSLIFTRWIFLGDRPKKRLNSTSSKTARNRKSIAQRIRTIAEASTTTVAHPHCAFARFTMARRRRRSRFHFKIGPMAAIKRVPVKAEKSSPQIAVPTWTVEEFGLMEKVDCRVFNRDKA